jgi:hypothetical protein
MTMLTEYQKSLIRNILEHQFFVYLDELPAEIAVTACQAARSLPYYLTVLDTLKEHDIESPVRQIGEMLSHPAPQNPCQNGINLPNNMRVGHRLVVAKTSGEKGLAVRKGLLNLFPNDDPEFPSSAGDVYEYIEHSINEKIKSLIPNVSNLDAIKHSDPHTLLIERPSIKRILAFDPNTFLNYPIESQLLFLEMTDTSYNNCNNDNLHAYQLFFSQFDIPKEQCATVEQLNILLSKWFKICTDELQETKNHIDEASRSLLSLVNIIEAKLSRYSHYILSPNANFYTYQALQRISFINGDASKATMIGSDYLYTAFMLALCQRHDALKNILIEKGRDFDINYANMLIAVYVNSGSSNPNTLETMLREAPIDNTVCNSLFYEVLLNTRDMEYSYQVRKILLRSSKFTETLSMETAKLCFSAAIQNDDFEMQMLVLAHSTKDFNSRKFLSINSVMKLLEDKCYAAVEKIMIRMFPYEMTINDLVAIQRLSNGMIDFDAKCSYSFSIVRPVTPTYNSHITPMFENARNSSSVIPLPVATSSSQSTAATLTRP